MQHIKAGINKLHDEIEKVRPPLSRAMMDYQLSYLKVTVSRSMSEVEILFINQLNHSL